MLEELHWWRAGRRRTWATFEALRCRTSWRLAAIALVACRAPAPQAPPPANLELEPDASRTEMSWQPYELVMACGSPPPGSGDRDVLEEPLLVVTSEEEYRRLFCRSSRIDWAAFRLVVHSEPMGLRRVLIDGVVRSDSEVLFVLRHAPDCEINDYEFQYQTVAVQIPRGPEPVRLFFAPGPAARC
jgi:hypothetical protein